MFVGLFGGVHNKQISRDGKLRGILNAMVILRLVISRKKITDQSENWNKIVLLPREKSVDCTACKTATETTSDPLSSSSIYN